MGTRKGVSRPDCTAQLEPGENAKYVEHSLAMMNWKQPDMSRVEEVNQRILDYFRLCTKNDMKPSFAGMALAFAVDRTTMWKWCNGTGDIKPLAPEIRNTLKKGQQILNAQMEDYMQNGKINPVSGIFLMKNNMGYTDQQEVVLRPDSPLGEKADPEALKRKYLEDAYGVIDSEKVGD